MPSFLHSGRIGDLIFGLNVIKHLGGGKLYLHRRFNAHKTPPGMSPIDSVWRLLEAQSYIEKVEVWDDASRVDYDLRNFPNHSLNGRGEMYNLVDMHYGACGIGRGAVDHGEPWLEVGRVKKIGNKTVCFHRSTHYRNPEFPWKHVVDTYGRRAFFVGLPEEHEDFQLKFGAVEHVRTKDVLEMAEAVAGCDRFFGNQGVGCALAEGFKKAVNLEACRHAPSCVFMRPGVTVFWGGRPPRFRSAYKFPVQTATHWEFPRRFPADGQI